MQYRLFTDDQLPNHRHSYSNGDGGNGLGRDGYGSLRLPTLPSGVGASVDFSNVAAGDANGFFALLLGNARFMLQEGILDINSKKLVTAISADQNNYDPVAGGTPAIFWMLQGNSAVARNITGFVAPAVAGTYETHLVYNIGGCNIVLKHENTSSTAANRISCPNNLDFTLLPGEGVLIIYYAGASRWKIIGKATYGRPTILSTIFDSISANKNDYAPTGFATCDALAIDVNAAVRTITGFDATGFTEGQKFLITGYNNAGGNCLTLANGSASSLSGNRMNCPGGANYTIGNAGGVEIIYLPTVNAASPFRVLGKA